MTATNKRYSYSRVVTIRIDVHHVGETRPTCHTHPTLSPRMVPGHTYLTWSTDINISCSCQQSWAGSLLPIKRAPDIIHNTTTDRSVSLYPVYLPSQPMKQWGQSQPSVDNRLLGLPSTYHWHAIGTFSACSWGSTHRSIIDTGGGLQYWRCRLSTYHSPTFSNDGLHFPHKGSVRSPI
jgi:hypothetical protein